MVFGFLTVMDELQEMQEIIHQTKRDSMKSSSPVEIFTNEFKPD